jgi:hypothetical protein
MFDVKNYNVYNDIETFYSIDIEILGHEITLKFITIPDTETGNITISNQEGKKCNLKNCIEFLNGDTKYFKFDYSSSQYISLEDNKLIVVWQQPYINLIMDCNVNNLYKIKKFLHEIINILSLNCQYKLVFT